LSAMQVLVETPRPPGRGAGEGREGLCRGRPAQRGGAEAGMEDAEGTGDSVAQQRFERPAVAGTLQMLVGLLVSQRKGQHENDDD
jgi:hypothetical protein